jgi:hypothetical protein
MEQDNRRAVTDIDISNTFALDAFKTLAIGH